MINHSQKILLEAIKNSLFGIEFSCSDDTDWDEVIKEAKAQTVMGLISTVLPVYDESCAQGKAYYMRILHEQDKLLKLLDENNIPCVILKGSAAAVYYPKPYLRSMGDVDFLVPRDNFENAMKIMESNGYIFMHGKDKNGNPKRHIGYKKNSIEFELHHHFSSYGFDMDDIIERAIPKREYRNLNGYVFPMLPDIENGLVLLGHIHQHLRYDSLGLRQILDWEMFLNTVINDDRWKNEFAPIAKEIGLLKLATNVTIMCEKHLGLPKKIQQLQNTDCDISDDLLEELLANGNFGRSQLPASSNSGENVRGIIATIKRKGLFSFFQDNCLSTWTLYRNHPVLKPVAFVYGLLWLFIKGLKYLFTTRNAKAQIEYARNKNDFYRNLGIKID